MTQKDYELIASVIRESYTEAHDKYDFIAMQQTRALVTKLADKLEIENSSFDRERFFDASGTDL